jgi:hypothetical protein
MLIKLAIEKILGWAVGRTVSTLSNCRQGFKNNAVGQDCSDICVIKWGRNFDNIDTDNWKF